METLIQNIGEWLDQAWNESVAAVSSPLFYVQILVVAAALLLTMLIASQLKRRIPLLRQEPLDGALLDLRGAVFRLRLLIAPLLAVILLGVSIEIGDATFGEIWFIRVAQGLAGIALLYGLISGLVQNRIAKTLLLWIGLPIAILRVLGQLNPIMERLSEIPVEFAFIDGSMLTIVRTVIFGALLFWLGAISNTAGKNVIRTRDNWNPNTRELAAKLFEITLFFVIFLLLLQLMDINLTTLAVFGGALGIGLGFGLQQIASNFISGIIILLDRSITPGDFVELEDGRSGWLRELNMRYGILETYDGKDIMVPNEQFITSSYTNWTHKDQRQRYSLHFQVSYSTDLDLLFDKVRDICRAHPKVLSDAELPIEFHPDAEIEGFGESGIDILCEFWMNGIDDGENRVGADLMHSIWRMIQAEGMSIPFPQREVRILGGSISVEKD